MQCSPGSNETGDIFAYWRRLEYRNSEIEIERNNYCAIARNILLRGKQPCTMHNGQALDVAASQLEGDVAGYGLRFEFAVLRRKPHPNHVLVGAHFGENVQCCVDPNPQKLEYLAA